MAKLVSPDQVNSDSRDTIITALRKLRRGEKLVYYTGDLMLSLYIRGVRDIANAAMSLSEAGRVYLTQRRLGDPTTHLNVVDWKFGRGLGFEYIATGA